MSQALKRRYTRLKKGEGQLPDILFIDGGRGQLSSAEKILEELQVEGVMLVGVAKGPTRKAGLESLIVSGGAELDLPPDNPALHILFNTFVTKVIDLRLPLTVIGVAKKGLNRY